MFSVIIPLYNKAPYIEKAIRSVAAQTFREFELIVINDGSTDNSLEVAKNIFDEISNDRTQTPPLGGFRVTSQPNTGVSTARNNGVKMAKYPYICFLDADDWWAPTFLEEMKSLIEEFPDAGIYGCGFHSVKNGQNRKVNLGVDDSFVKGYVNYAQLLLKGNTRPVWTGASVLKKNLFNDVGGFVPLLKLGEDFDLFFKVYLKSGLALMNKELAFYSQDANPKFRAITKKYYPREETVFFNLNYPEQFEDDEVKLLVEFLKLRSLYPYFLKGMYKNEVKEAIKDIDFKKHDRKYYWQYKVLPIWLQNLWHFSLRTLYNIKIMLCQ